jgi:hypothetical protein
MLELESNRAINDEILSLCRVCRVWSFFPKYPLREEYKLTLGKSGCTLHTLHSLCGKVYEWTRKTIVSICRSWEASQKWSFDEYWW